MLYAIILFVLFSFISYRLIGNYDARGKVLISSIFSLVFSSAAYYTFHIKRMPPTQHIIQFDHYTFLYFITLIIVSMGFSLILEMMSDSGRTVRRERSSNPFTRVKIFFRTQFRYLHLMRLVMRNGLFKSPLHLNAEARNQHIGASLRKTLEQAGGVFVKFGQFLSTRTDLFSPVFIEEMAHLQENVRSLPGEEVRKIIEAQLKRPIDEIFQTFDEEPLAAASIAQVHRATLHTGERVVVKVLRPELKEQMEVDVTILDTFAHLLESRMPWAQSVNITSIAEGFIDNLYEEVDLSIELSNIIQMRKTMDNVVYIPKVYPDYCTSEILVVEFLDGVSLSKSAQYPVEKRRQLASEIFEEMLAQIFDRGVFHGDPHPGNIYILKDGTPAFLDFGSVGKLSAMQRRGFTWLLIGITRQNPESMAIGVERLVENGDQINLKKLEQALSQFLVVHSFDGDILEDMGTDLFEMMGDFGLQFHPNVAMAFRSLITLQGSLQETDPTFNLSEVMKTFLKSQLTMSKGKEVIEQTIEDELLNTLPRLRAFPRRIDRVLRQAENGDFTIQMGIFSHKENKQFANEVLNLVFLSFAGISFGILSLGALFLAQNEIQEGYSFLNIFGYSGLGLSVIMLIRVAIQSMYRTKK